MSKHDPRKYADEAYYGRRASCPGEPLMYLEPQAIITLLSGVALFAAAISALAFYNRVHR
jgi:hypothetical protein